MTVDPLLLPVIRDFASETSELCQGITLSLLELERRDGSFEQRAAAYDSALRKLHTLKGSAATLGLADISELVHRMETLLAPCKTSGLPIERSAADALLHGLDALLSGVQVAAEGQVDARVVKARAEVDLAIIAARPEVEGAPGSPIEQSSTADDGIAATPREPAAAPTDEVGTSFRVEGRQVQDLSRSVESMREVRLRIEERRKHVDSVLERLRRGGTVDAGSLRASLASVSRGLREDGEEASGAVESLEDGLQSICTLPARTITEPLHRAVRDLCAQSGKEARLSIVGADLSIDRRVLLALKGPIVHLLRNAVVHGIESPSEREERGKHREGAIVVRLERAGNVLSTEVSDDGNGLDIEKIRSAAERGGFVPAAKLATMRPAELQNLIFLPGLSTTDDVTEASGRGVGLDAVKSQVRGMDGQLDVHSTPRHGTRFTLTLPLDLGSTSLLIVRVGEQHFGIPMLAVESGRAFREDEVRRSRHGLELRFGEGMLPMRDLGQCLGLRDSSTPVRGQPVVLCQAMERRVAILVDQVVESRDLALHPLPRELRDLTAYQGAATLALGELLLVLSPGWLAAQGERDDGNDRTGAPHALVVDDSLTARAIYRTILESAGWTVHAAATAAQALEQAQHATYDVILVDILLGETNGIDLVAKLRGRADMRTLPIIVVSTEGGETERRRAANAGASLFLTKAECGSGRLLDEVSWLLSRRERAS